MEGRPSCTRRSRIGSTLGEVAASWAVGGRKNDNL